MKKRGFTLIEVLIVAAIMVILAYLGVIGVGKWRGNAKLARVSTELTNISTAVTQYAEDNNYTYPPDTPRGLPGGLQNYLAGGQWPTSVWPEGVFDWDNWTTVNGVASPQILQVTYRLCDTDDPIETCKDGALFPHFGRNSSIFYCVHGPCVPHQNDPYVPGYCVNCKPKEQNPPL